MSAIQSISLSLEAGIWEDSQEGRGHAPVESHHTALRKALGQLSPNPRPGGGGHPPGLMHYRGADIAACHGRI